jgi:hypothetical protein
MFPDPNSVRTWAYSHSDPDLQNAAKRAYEHHDTKVLQWLVNEYIYDTKQLRSGGRTGAE